MIIKDKIIKNPKFFLEILINLFKEIYSKSKSENKKLIKKKNINIDNKYNEQYTNISDALLKSEKKIILIGSYITSSIDYSKILSILIDISKITNSNLGVMTEGANTAGAWITEFLPYKRTWNDDNKSSRHGLNALEMFTERLKSYITFGIEIEHDCLYAKEAIKAFKNANFILSFSSFKSKYLFETANVILPIASSYEISGTFINISGLPQSFNAAIPHGYEIKQGWLAIDELAQKLKQPGFNYISIEEILKEIKINIQIKNKLIWNEINVENLDTNINKDFSIIPTFSNYSIDPLLRRATALQNTYIKHEKAINVNSITYNKLKIINNFTNIKNVENNDTDKYFVLIDNDIADDTIVIDNKNIADNTEFVLQISNTNFEKS